MDSEFDEFRGMASTYFEEQLRAIRYYDEDGGDLLYRRADIEGYENGAEQQIYELARLDTRGFTKDLWKFSAGKFRGSVRFLTHANLINVPTGPEEGVIVSVEKGVDSTLERFGDDARSWLAASSLWTFSRN